MACSFKTVLFTAVVVTGALAAAFPVDAQISNKPFAFKNSPGGLGMSFGGKQAIINQKIEGITPENLLRAPDGSLLNVRKGPGNSAIVSQENGSVVPEYRGTDFRGGNPYMEAGVFNPYFGAIYHDDSYYAYTDFQTAAVIGAWVASVAAADMPVSYYDPANPITAWTFFVNSFNRF